MAFVFTAHNWPPDIMSVAESDFSSKTVIIGYDNIDDTVYSAIVQFVEEDGDIQFMLALGESNERDGEDFILDSQVAGSIIQKGHRQRVLNIFLHIACDLVEGHGPSRFLIRTYLPNLPSKALVKFDRLRTVFGTFGYTPTYEALPDGHHCWHMNRLA